jgi:hypothetical protein
LQHTLPNVANYLSNFNVACLCGIYTMKNARRKLMISAALAGAISLGSADAATVTSSFTDRQGELVNWTALVDPGVTLSLALCCTLPDNQGDGSVKNFVNTAFNTSFSANVGKQDSLSGFGVNWTGPSADIFAIHFGGKGGGNELLIDLSGNTSTFSFSMTGTKHELSSIQGFGNGSVSQAPLPAALPLFASGLGGIALVAWARRKWKKAAADAVA